MSKLMLLNGYTFDWISSGRPDVGVLAQEIQTVFPELVKTMDNGTKAVEYPNLIALVIEAVKELNTTVDQLRTDYVDLQAISNLYDQYSANATAIAALDARVSTLENLTVANQDPNTAIGALYNLCAVGTITNRSLSIETIKLICNSIYTPFVSVREALRTFPNDTHLQEMYDTYYNYVLLIYDYLGS